MRIAVMTFNGFNEIDSCIVSALLNRVNHPGWKAEIVAPASTVVSMNGVTMHAQRPLTFANQADVVLFGSGTQTARLVEDVSLISQLRLSPDRQLIGSQCSGALFLHKLGLLGTGPVCTDTTSRPVFERLKVNVVDMPFCERGNVATAGGCLASPYLAMWVILRLCGLEVAKAAIRYAAPVGQKDEYLARAIDTVTRGQRL
ncbi:MAG: DJ-1/PfpI family protein [Pseudomonadota bacterium]